MKKISLILMIIWMGFIFYNSSRSGTASNLVSYKVTNTIRTEKSAIVNDGNSNHKIQYSRLPKTKKDEKINIFVRKNAHAFEYFVLALIVSGCVFYFLNLKGKKAVVYIAFICLLYAVTDEFHQSFVPGRQSLISDVLIDFIGSIIGMIIFYSVYYNIFNLRKIKRN
ncbi:MAG: VanZ family protein [Bacillota bacterium]|nr:VanZ family protein [Bacillota bacterium]